MRDLPGLIERMNVCHTAAILLHKQWEDCLDSLTFDVSEVNPLDHQFTKIDELKEYLKTKYETNTGEKWKPWYKGGKARFNMKVKQRKAKRTAESTVQPCKDKDHEMTDEESMETTN